jgi:hypothetical protein
MRSLLQIGRSSRLVFLLIEKVCLGIDPDKFIKVASIAKEINEMVVLRSSDAGLGNRRRKEKISRIPHDAWQT